MRFRLSDEEVRSLYATGSPGRYPSAVISAFFGSLEAIEAASALADLEALVSLRSETQADGRVLFGLPSDWYLEARPTTEEGVAVLIIKMFRGAAKGGPGG